ncbi:hypothetical protein PMAYCL1PPCAC_01488, partial [Pristionchus mayeri]
DSFENEGFSGDNFERMDEPMLNEDMDDNTGCLNAISGDQIENDGGDEETDDCDVHTPKDSSKNAVVEKRRRSSRKVSGNVKYTESGEESDEETGPTMKKGRSESVGRSEKVVPNRSGKCKGKSQSEKRLNAFSKERGREK